MTVWFVTPAWQRFELSAICFEQRKRVIDELAAGGVEAHQVVVADDRNLDIAASFGFDTVEQSNDWLGRKFNDGMQYAAEHGATWIVPIGSDSWIDPAYLLPLPTPSGRHVRTSQLYAPVLPDELAICRVRHEKNPAGPHMFHRDLLAPVGFRPMPDEITKRTDSNTVKTLWPIAWEYRDVHPLQYIGFRVPPFITRYDRLWSRWGIERVRKPWALLAEYYDADLVDRARRLMAR